MYFTLSIIHICHYFSSRKDLFSSDKNRNWPWITLVLGSLIIVFSIELFTMLTTLQGHIFTRLNIIVIANFSLSFIYINAILLMALKNPSIFNMHSHTWTVSPNEQIEIFYGLTRLFEEEKIYKNPDLTVNLAAQKLSINPRYLSLIISKEKHNTFPEFINEYRIDETKKLLIEKPELTIQQIMYEVGYNSKSTFNLQFKKHTGLTPSEYRSQQNKVQEKESHFKKTNTSELNFH